MGAVFVPGIVKAMSSAGRLLMTPVRPPMTSNFKLTEAAAPATRFTVQVFPPGALLAVSVRSPVPSLKAMRAADGVDGALLYSKNTTPRKLPVTTLTWSAWTLVASPVAVLMLPPPCVDFHRGGVLALDHLDLPVSPYAEMFDLLSSRDRSDVPSHSVGRGF